MPVCTTGIGVGKLIQTGTLDQNNGEFILTYDDNRFLNGKRRLHPASYS